VRPDQEEHSIPLPLVSEDEESVCLPLVINVISKYWGQDISSEQALELAKKYPSIKGTVMMEGIELAEQHGMVTYTYKGSLKDLKKRIDQGIPPIVILPGIRDTVQYASIVSGYEDRERRILTYVPKPETIGAIPESKFVDDWQQDDMTTIVIIPKDMGDVLRNEELKFLESNRVCLQAEKMRLQGLATEAIEKLRNALSFDSDNPQCWCLLGSLYNELDSAECIGCYDKAIILNPRYYLAYRGLGNYFLKRKEYSKAESYFTKALGINPLRYGPIYKNRAFARLQLGNTLKAKNDLIKYLEQVPDALDRKTVEQALGET
jgi:hypothetical protein